MARTRLLVAGMALALSACGTGGAPTASPAGQAASPVTTTAPTSPPTTAALATTLPSIAPRPLPGCLNPACVPGRLARPGALPAGPYTTRYFLASRLGVVMPAGWESPEDSSGEFKVQPAGKDITTLDFWIDIYPIVDGTDPAEPVKGFDGTAAALLAWLAANPNIDTTDPKPAKLGGLDAQVVDITRSPKAKNVDPGCPSVGQPCVGLFANAWWDGGFYSQGGPFKLRLFAADASWGGIPHGVYAMITTDSVESFAAFEAAAEAIVASAVFPPDVQQP